MPNRPNLLIIWTDEQRADTMACYGNDHIHTPHLNRLASESFVFENAYCVQPVCTPSRGCIMTGLYPHQHGAWTNNVPLKAEVKTIAELVDPAYHCAYYGKWHLGDEIVAQHGFDDWKSIEDSIYRSHYSKPEYLERRSDYHYYLEKSGFPAEEQVKDGAMCYSRHCAALMAEPFTKAGFLGQEASDFLRRQTADQPFILSVNFLEPHMPFYGPLNDLYDPAEVPTGPAFNQPPAESASLRNRGWAVKHHGRFGGMPISTDDEWRRLKANYYGLVTMVDNAVGNILAALDASGLADNTIVVYTSDHGEMMGDHAQLSKCVLYEESVRIPWLIRVPWLKREQTMLPGRVSQIDMVPTLLDLLEQPLPSHLQGESRKPVLEGKADLADNDAFVIWRGGGFPAGKVEIAGVPHEQIEAIGDQEWVSIVSHDGWKLNLCTTDPHCELYDLNTDPHELDNKFTEPAQQERVRELYSRIEAWQATSGVGIPMPALQA